MPFEPQKNIINFRQSPPPLLKESERKYYDLELRKLEQCLTSITEAIEEMRVFLKTLP